MVYNHHCLMKRAAQGDYQCVMAVDVEGHVEPDRVRNALAVAMAAHPETMAGLRISLTRGRPYWRLPRSPEDSGPQAAAAAHRFTDLRTEPADQERLQRLIQKSLAEQWDYADGPSIRLDQYALASGSTRFCLRWPHFLTDADGAQQFLRDMGRFDQEQKACCEAANPASPPTYQDVRETIDPLAEYSTSQRIRLFRRALIMMREQQIGRVESLHAQRFPPASGHGLLNRHWNEEAIREMHALARSATPAGPGLYARHLIACVMRAIHRVYVERGVQTDAYVITMPFRVRLPERPGETAPVRPVRGNYLVPLTIYTPRELVHDPRSLGSEILRQYRRFLDERMDVLWCSVMWMLSHLRLSMYQSLSKLKLGNAPLASGFTYFGEIDPPIRSFGGSKVTNIWGTGVVATPPGWNAAFSRFGETLNLAMIYARPAVTDELAVQYAGYIESEMFRRT
jgi:hypothetical protein